MYGKGYKLLERAGYAPGQGLGKEVREGIGTPLPSGDVLTQGCRHLKLDDDSTDDAQLVRHVSRASIDPPKCTGCKENRWPAYRTIRSLKWTCKWCAQVASPTCAKCQTRTWDGYNIPKDGFPDILMGKWLCASCWTSSPEQLRVVWEVWFTRRARRYPEVLVECHTQEPKSTNFESYEWTPGRASGSMEKCEKEYPLGRKGWKALYWDGQFPSPDDCASELDLDFFR